MIRPWPEGVEKKRTMRPFVASYRAVFDADPDASFCAAEVDGLTIVVAVGHTAEKLQRFVTDELYGEIQRVAP